MGSICGADCGACQFTENCKGCEETCGRTFGGCCVAAEYIKFGGKEKYGEFKEKLRTEVNELLGQNGDYGPGQGVMGHILADEIGSDAFFAIGTDFYRTKVNLPSWSGERSNHVFYSHDTLAKSASLNGLDICWIDFSDIPEDSPLKNQVTDYCYMGSLGEVRDAWIMLFIPISYRVYKSPAKAYDGIINVKSATPTEPRAE